MSLIIDKGNNNRKSLQKKSIGNLVIETTTCLNDNIVDLRNGKDKVVRNRFNSNNASSEKVETGIKFKNDEMNQSLNKKESVKKLVNSTKSMKILKGQKISLNQISSDSSKLIIALDWDNKSDFDGKIDLDTSIFMTDKNNVTSEENFIFYNNLESPQGGIVLKSDHNSNLKNQYNEVVQLDLDKIPLNIEKLAFTVTIYECNETNNTFKYISNAYFRLIDIYSKEELLTYRFDEGLNEQTAIVVAEIYRYKNQWKISFIGSGFNGGLEALCNNYGIETE